MIPNVSHLVLAALCLTMMADSALAQPKQAPRPKATSPNSQSSKPSTVKAVKAVKAEQSRAALAFAKTHHPELAKLLAGLRQGNEKEYARALRQLVAVHERLSRLAARDEDRYALQLEAWKLDSRLKLLAARMTMVDDRSIEEQMRDLVRQRVDVRNRLLLEERARLAERIERIDAQVESSQRDDAVERELKRIRSAVRSRSGNPKRPQTNGTVETSTSKSRK